MNFHAFFFGFFHDAFNDFGSGFVKEAAANFHTKADLFEGIGHAAADDHFVDFIEEAVD